MIHFTPTLGIKDTAKNSNDFVKKNLSVFWDIFKPFLPYVIGLAVFDMVITHFFMPINKTTGEAYEFPLGGLIAGYFYTCLAITWHRVVIHGAENYEPMNPFNPKKSELAFVGMGIALFMGMFFGGFFLGMMAALINPALIVLVLPFIIIGTWIWMKLMFYFPAKATGRHISLRQSFSMTTGYIWKMIASSFLAYLKLLLIMIAYVIAGSIVIAGVAFLFASLGISEKIASVILGSIFAIPLFAFFQPVFAIIWVTVLSNYYQYVMQNEPAPASEN